MNEITDKPMNKFSSEEIKILLKQIKDPEIPVIDIVELGVLREVVIENEIIHIIITPTYSGCPAMRMIEDEIKDKLRSQGIENFVIKTVYSPAWSTDWLSMDARQKLVKYGIAPPTVSTEKHLEALMQGKAWPVQCPFCRSADTRVTSAFSSTACKALHYCRACAQPFEEFKCH